MYMDVRHTPFTCICLLYKIIVLCATKLNTNIIKNLLLSVLLMSCLEIVGLVSRGSSLTPEHKHVAKLVHHYPHYCYMSLFLSFVSTVAPPLGIKQVIILII